MQECVCYLGVPRSALMQLSDLGRKNILLRRTFQTELVQVEPRLSDFRRRKNYVTTVLLGMRESVLADLSVLRLPSLALADYLSPCLQSAAVAQGGCQQGPLCRQPECTGQPKDASCPLGPEPGPNCRK
ncbi:hypothetical protein AOLI_G00311780 [Acnodon oligacanthus]